MEAEVVADHRAGTGLTADRPRLEDQGVQTLGSTVDRRCETSRSGAEHNQVVGECGGPDLDSVGAGELAHRWLV
jgi:hypothetical protein